MNKMLLSGLVNSHPLVRVAIKYWWLVLPAGVAFWTLVQRRDKKDIAGIIQDFALVFPPIFPLIMLSEMTLERDAKKMAGVSQTAGIQGALKEASFTVQPIAPAPPSGPPQYGTL